MFPYSLMPGLCGQDARAPRTKINGAAVLIMRRPGAHKGRPYKAVLGQEWVSVIAENGRISCVYHIHINIRLSLRKNDRQICLRLA